MNMHKKSYWGSSTPVVSNMVSIDRSAQTFTIFLLLWSCVYNTCMNLCYYNSHFGHLEMHKADKPLAVSVVEGYQEMVLWFLGHALVIKSENSSAMLLPEATVNRYFLRYSISNK